MKMLMKNRKIFNEILINAFICFIKISFIILNLKKLAFEKEI